MPEAPSDLPECNWLSIPLTDEELRIVDGYAHDTGLAMQDAAAEALLAHIREVEGVRLVLARLKGSPPSRAELLTGFSLVEAPSAQEEIR